jgi:hypothetical protein
MKVYKENSKMTVWVAFKEVGSEYHFETEVVGVFVTREEANATDCDYAVPYEVGVDQSKEHSNS